MTSHIRTHRLTGLDAPAFDDKPFWVLDIETGAPGDVDSLGGRFVCGQMRRSDARDESYWFYDIADMLDFILSRSCRGMKIYAHNGAGYDYLYIVQYLLSHKDDFPGVECKYLMRGDGRVICATFKKNKHCVKLLDTFHVFPKSLKAFTGVFAPEYIKKERPWRLPDGSINWFDPTDPCDREYLDYDCLGLIAALESFRKLIHHQFGVNIGMTAASTAMKAWRVTLREDETYWRTRPRVEAFARASYCGGYVFLTTTERLRDRVHVDINAAYADAMRKGVPTGVAAYTDRYVPGYPAFYRVIAHCPQGERYPIVPLKTESGVRWPVGESFETIIPSCTLDYAQTLGYTFTILDGYVFDEISHPFTIFLQRCEQLELAHKGDAIGEAAKLLRNSLYGKFGMSPVTEKVIYTDEPTDEQTPMIDRVTGAIIDDFYVQKEELSAPYMQIHWASWITAQTRIKTHMIARATNASYGDTDSADMAIDNCKAAIDSGLITIGKRYGEVKIEHHFAWFQANAPKDYIGYLADDEWHKHQETCDHCVPDHRYVQRAKSMPRSLVVASEHIVAPIDNVSKSYRSVISFKALLKQPESDLALDRTRKYSTLEHSVSWILGENGQVYSRPLGTSP